MKKESWTLYYIRFTILIVIFIFMVMQYWSSSLIEEKLQRLNGEIVAIKKQMTEGQFQTPMPSQESDPVSDSKPIAEVVDSPNNMLSPDPFYAKILPDLLGPNFRASSQRKEGTYGKPDNLHPFSQWEHVIEWIGLCTISLSNSKVGIYETYTPSAALDIEIRKNDKGQDEYWVKLRQNMFWAPLQQKFFGDSLTLAPQFLKKNPITAHDFKFYFDAIMNKGVEEQSAVTLRAEYVDVEEFKVIDDYTFTVRWKAHETKNEKGEIEYKPIYRSKALTTALVPLPRFVYQYFSNGKKIIEDDSNPETYRTNPLWAQNFSHHWANNIIVSCGPWLFDGMTDREIRFKRNPDYYNPLAALTDSYSVIFKNSGDGVWEDFKAGTLDLLEIPSYQLADLANFMMSTPYLDQEKKGLAIKKLEYLQRAFSYVGWNEAKPYFKNKKVRQALTLSIDRERIIKQNLNGMGMQTTGPFSPSSPSYDKTIKPYPFDPARALELLHEEGWFDSTGSGILTKEIDGKQVPFEFSLTYFVKNLNSKAICEYISTALKDVGIQCTPNGVETADLSKVFEDRNFDALFLAWGASAPPEDPKQIWYSSEANEKGSSNAIGFSNKEADAIMDRLSYEYDEDKRNALLHKLHAIIHDEAPYTFLYVPKTTLVYRQYLQNVFIPADRQDLIPGANVSEPISSIFWIKSK